MRVKTVEIRLRASRVRCSFASLENGKGFDSTGESEGYIHIEAHEQRVA